MTKQVKKYTALSADYPTAKGSSPGKEVVYLVPIEAFRL